MKRQLQPHGTVAAWQRHKYHQEEPCEACKEGKREYDRLHKNYANNKRWRRENPMKRQAAKQRNYAQTRGARNSHQEWTLGDVIKVLDHTVPDRELSKLIGRSVQGIQAMRHKAKQDLQDLKEEGVL